MTYLMVSMGGVGSFAVIEHHESSKRRRSTTDSHTDILLQDENNVDELLMTQGFLKSMIDSEWAVIMY